IPISATSAFPSMLSYNGPRLGKWYTRMTHRFFQSAFWMASHKPIKRFWKDIDKQPPVRIQNPYPWFEREGFPVLYGFSRHVIPPPDDWGASIQVTGYWIPPVVSGWEPPKALCAFLDAGEAPVYVGFGSIRGAQMQQDMEHAMKALKELGHRVVMTSSAVHPSWNTDASIFVLESAPHRWLFPRMRAVIHHGGAGTTAAGLCAGVPSVVVPYSNDQPMWAQRVQELGVGLKLTSKQRTSSNAWKRVLQEVLEPSVCANAKVLGEKIRAEEGIHEACDAIERLFSGAHETRK
ncbi:MAG: glycosyltransferase, partial [Myxococcota bacterium]